MKRFFLDGAFGTYYRQVGGRCERCEEANLFDPETVLRIHREYLQAGADGIKTNTFAVRPSFSENWRQVLRAGYRLAEEAAGGEAAVFADIGSIQSEERAGEEYLEVAREFCACGAKNFLFETLAQLDDLLPAVALIRQEVPGARIFVSFAAFSDGYTQKGCDYKDLLRRAAQVEGIEAVGLNCVCGPSHVYRLLSQMDRTGLRLLAMPNAGYPANVGGRTVYEDNPAYFAAKLCDIAGLDVPILGGCCGTTPAHIAMAVQAVEGKPSQEVAVPAPPLQRAQRQGQSPFLTEMQAGRKAVAVEIDPPEDLDIHRVLSFSKAAKEAGADVITVADSPLARTRADSFLVAARIKREVGIDVLPHLSCRDRNHIAVKGTLLGGAMEGIRNVLAITGDPIISLEHGVSKGVFAFNSYRLISYIKSLSADVLAASPYAVGGALNVNAERFDAELKRAVKKVECGAQFLLTQPIFTWQAEENLRKARNTLSCKLLAGIMPVAGYKNALFLNNEVSGISVPEDLLAALQGKSREEAADISVRFGMEVIRRVFDCCDGFYLMTPLKRIDLTTRLAQEIRNFETGRKETL